MANRSHKVSPHFIVFAWFVIGLLSTKIWNRRCVYGCNFGTKLLSCSHFSFLSRSEHYTSQSRVLNDGREAHWLNCFYEMINGHLDINHLDINHQKQTQTWQMQTRTPKPTWNACYKLTNVCQLPNPLPLGPSSLGTISCQPILNHVQQHLKLLAGLHKKPLLH